MGNITAELNHLCIFARLLSGHKGNSDAAAAFLHFVNQRQQAFVQKYKGQHPFTENSVLARKWFTNMYRECDRGTAFFKRHILTTVLSGAKRGLKATIDVNLVRKVAFRSILYRLINKLETFENFGSIPGEEEFNSFITFLRGLKDEGSTIFTAAHQNMGFDRLMVTFKYVRQNIKVLSRQVVEAAEGRSLKKIQEVFQSIPNVGGFFAWQMLCDLLEARVLGECTDNQWTCLGPGAKNGLSRIFGRHSLNLTRVMRDLSAHSGPQSGFLALGIKFPAFLGRPLSLKNVEHALCEFDKYYR